MEAADGRRLAQLRRGGRAERKTVDRIRANLGSAVDVYQTSDEALAAFRVPRKAIILLGHGYCNGAPTDWSLDDWNDNNPLLRWSEVPAEIPSRMLLFASCNAAALGADARDRLPKPGVVITPSRELDLAYNEDAMGAAYELAFHALDLAEDPTSHDIQSTWKSAERSLKRSTEEIGHHDWDFSLTWTEGDTP